MTSGWAIPDGAVRVAATARPRSHCQGDQKATGSWQAYRLPRPPCHADQQMPQGPTPILGAEVQHLQDLGESRVPCALVAGRPAYGSVAGRLLAVASWLRAAAIWVSRSFMACWYRRAAWGVEWPRRFMSSARVAPVWAARTAPVWRRSCQRRSGRPAAL